jgi:hypothetical protein
MQLSFKHTLFLLERRSVLCLKLSAMFSLIGAGGRVVTEFIKSKQFISTCSKGLERDTWITHQHIMHSYCESCILPKALHIRFRSVLTSL